MPCLLSSNRHPERKEAQICDDGREKLMVRVMKNSDQEFASQVVIVEGSSKVQNQRS